MSVGQHNQQYCFYRVVFPQWLRTKLRLRTAVNENWSLYSVTYHPPVDGHSQHPDNLPTKPYRGGCRNQEEARKEAQARQGWTLGIGHTLQVQIPGVPHPWMSLSHAEDKHAIPSKIHRSMCWWIFPPMKGRKVGRCIHGVAPFWPAHARYSPSRYMGIRP